MIKTLSALSIILFLWSCSNQEKTNEDLESEKVSSEENVAKTLAEPVETVEGFVGSWTVDAATAGIKVDLTLNSDGSLTQKMGEQEQIGSWVRIDQNHLRITSTGAPKGQTWEIVSNTADQLEICWNPESDKPKMIPFKRVSE